MGWTALEEEEGERSSTDRAFPSNKEGVNNNSAAWEFFLLFFGDH